MRRATAIAATLLTVACASRALAADEPTKQQAVEHLKGFVAALEASDFDRAMTYLAMPAGGTAEQLKKALARMVQHQEITKQGLEVLAAHGTWGKLSEVAPDKAAKWAEDFKVPVGQCWGLVYERAEAAFHFDPKGKGGLKIIRCDDIGKLKR
jgi:hypothetical protein